MTRRFATRHLRAAALTAVVVFGLGLGLAGCASEPDTGDALHASVVRVAERSADEDFTGALAELLLLERDVDEAVAAGDVGAAHEAEIRAAIELVRADLETAEEGARQAATPTPTPTPSDAGDDDDDDDSDPGNSGDNRNDDENRDKEKGKGED
ncbi:hypothetical protein [Agromyces lapidis]|uniref:Mucin-associated surface protein n=1 Tax=Agromyces lapidis TaxID=279574 RepID=A0ABV5SKY4_9MICO|nr:hypothetical protein [Agromyces lapidis]